MAWISPKTTWAKSPVAASDMNRIEGNEAQLYSDTSLLPSRIDAVEYKTNESASILSGYKIITFSFTISSSTNVTVDASHAYSPYERYAYVSIPGLKSTDAVTVATNFGWADALCTRLHYLPYPYMVVPLENELRLYFASYLYQWYAYLASRPVTCSVIVRR